METATLEQDVQTERDLAEARIYLDWSRSLPEHRLSFDAWCERELTRAARSA